MPISIYVRKGCETCYATTRHENYNTNINSIFEYIYEKVAKSTLIYLYENWPTNAKKCAKNVKKCSVTTLHENCTTKAKKILFSTYMRKQLKDDLVPTIIKIALGM